MTLDVFAMLIYFYHICHLIMPMFMSSPIKDRASFDIAATAAENHDIAPDVLAIHGLTGCDTVASTYGIGKATAVKVAKDGALLHSIGEQTSNLNDVQAQATSFMAKCHGKHVESCRSMTEARQKIWAHKTGKGTSSAPKLCSLPPTSEAFLENVKRCHLQVCLWKSAIYPDPPLLDPLDFGWEADHSNKTVEPRTLPDNTALAPDYVLKLIRCMCHMQEPCKAAHCSCVCNQLACTIFCVCEGSKHCCNPHTTHADTDADDEECEYDEVSDTEHEG